MMSLQKMTYDAVTGTAIYRSKMHAGLKRNFQVMSGAACRGLVMALLALGVAFIAPRASAEVSEVKVASGASLGYLPYHLMEHYKLFEKHATVAGLGDVKASYVRLTGGAVMNDALLSGSLQVSSVAVPAFLILWAKTRGTPQEVRAAVALNSVPVFLNTRNPTVKSIKDFSDKDRIAVTAVKVSVHAIIIQMAAAQAFGDTNYARLDPITIPLPHPSARDALLSGAGSITAHQATEPFAGQEFKAPGIHTVLTSYDVFGGPASTNLVVLTSKFRSENPKTYAAFLAALDEAIAMINKDRKAAAEIYVQMHKSSSRPEEILAMLEDKKAPHLFSTTPSHVTKFSDFMYKVGTIQVKPSNWKDLFFPEAHHLPGS